MTSRLPNKIVDENYQLRELIAHLSPKPIIGIDTEFHSENRYHPKLMLIQVCDFEGGNWLVDPLQLRVEPLGRALRDSIIVMHGGQEDLRILYRELGFTPAEYFDIQIAVGMLGYEYPLRYSILIQEILGKKLHQTSTLSDWSQRPLSEEQCEYALDDVLGPYQDDNTFYNVTPGFHTVYVRDKNNCGIADQIISVIGFPNFFTPNDDGYNDSWHVYGINTPSQAGSKIYIFDRYGKLLKELSYNSLGWDGTYNGNPMPTSDYWFYIELNDNRIFRGHFTLKR